MGRMPGGKWEVGNPKSLRANLLKNEYYILVKIQ